MSSKTSYYADADLLSFLKRSERKLKNLFYVCLANSAICLPCFWFTLLTDGDSDGTCPTFVIVGSVVVLFCLLGLWYCYSSSRDERLKFERMLQQEKEEINAAVDEIERKRQKKN